MIKIILFHWATHLFLVWLMVIVVANLWPRKKRADHPQERGFHRGVRKENPQRNRSRIKSNWPIAIGKR